MTGKVALASTTTPPSKGRFVHRMETFGHAVAAGAEAFVFANHVPGQLPPTGTLRFNAEAAVPGVGVSKETGAWLSEYADRDGHARLSVSATTEPGTSRNVHGTLGPDTDGELLVVGHYDAHDIAEGALDNGCGIAVVVGMARLLAGMDLDRRVRIAGVGCEEVGLMGSEALADALDLDRVRAVVNVDGAGRSGISRPSPTPRRRSRTSSSGPVTSGTSPSRSIAIPIPTDHWPFLREGVPALQLQSQSGECGRDWGHTHADTRDKADPRNLREHAMLGALLVRKLTRADPPRIDGDALCERMREADLEAGMRAAEVWPDGWDEGEGG